MSVYRLRLLGHEVASWEIERDSAEVLADAIAELADNTEEHTSDHTEPLRWEACDD